MVFSSISSGNLFGSDRRNAPLFPLQFASLGFGASPHATEYVKEKRTGVDFPFEYCPAKQFGARHCPKLTGTGVRSKRIAGIKNLDIYAMALYVDPEATKHTLCRKFDKIKDQEILSRDQQLYEEVISADCITKTLRIIITSGLVKRGNFLDALNERLAPPLQKKGESSLLMQFTSQFDDAKFRKGLEICFTSEGKKLVTRLDGKEAGVINSKTLVNALFDIYLGKDPVSKDAKLCFGRGLASIILA